MYVQTDIFFSLAVCLNALYSTVVFKFYINQISILFTKFFTKSCKPYIFPVTFVFIKKKELLTIYTRVCVAILPVPVSVFKLLYFNIRFLATTYLTCNELMPLDLKIKNIMYASP